jgi:hypothetical protein
MFTITKIHVLPTQWICGLVWIWEQTAIISLYSINWLVLGAFEKLLKEIISFVISVSPSDRLSVVRMEHLGSHRTDFDEI